MIAENAKCVITQFLRFVYSVAYGYLSVLQLLVKNDVVVKMKSLFGLIRDGVEFAQSKFLSMR